MKNRNNIFFIFIFISSIVFSQKNNKPEELLKTAEDFLTINLDSCSFYLSKIDIIKTNKTQGYYYYIKANLLMKQGAFKNAIDFFNKANIINKTTNYTMYINGLHKSGLSYIYINKYNISISYFKREIALEKKLDTIINTAKAYGNIAVAYRRIDKIDSSIYYNKKALYIYQLQKDSTGIISILNNLGNLYRDFDIENSNKYYNKALETSYKLPNTEEKIAVINQNLGINYVNTKNYNKALELLQESYQYFLKKENKLRQAFVLNNIGFCYLNTNQPQKAISFIKKAINIYQTNNNKEGETFAFINLADVYYQIGNYKNSEKYYTKALAFAQEINELQLISKSYLGLFENAIQLKNKKESILFFEKYNSTKDSIYKQNKIKELVKYKTELKLEKTQHQLELARKDKKIKEQKITDNQILLKQKDTIIKLSILFSVALIISIIFLIFFFRKQKKINKLLKRSQEELNTKSLIIDHHNKNLELIVAEKTKKLTKEIEQRKIIEKELVIAKELAEESDRLKSEFLSNISHEIRTPLNSIMGFSDIIVENNVEEEDIIPYTTIIRKNGFLLLGIINDLIDIAKIEANVLHVKKIEINISTLFEEIKSELNSKLKYLEKENKIEIKYNFPTNYQDDIIITDNEKLITIFNRLLNNAVQYTEKGFIEIGYHKVGEQYNFYITDTGIGIPTDRLHQIFKNFRKFRKNENFNYRGLGVGLFIAHKLLQMMDSQLEVKSVVNKGSTFYFSL